MLLLLLLLLFFLLPLLLEELELGTLPAAAAATAPVPLVDALVRRRCLPSIVEADVASFC